MSMYKPFLKGKWVYKRYSSTYMYMYQYCVPVLCIYDGIKTVVRQKFHDWIIICSPDPQA